MASDQASTAVWDGLPPITGGLGLIAQATERLRQEDSPGGGDELQVNMLQPSQKHMSIIEGKRAMLIMDTCISKVLLVAAFPQIVANMQYYELLLGREVKLLFEEYARVSTEYEALLAAAATEAPVNCNRVRELKDRLFDVTRRITRCIVAEPAVTAALIRHYREWRIEPRGAVRDLASQLVQLRFILRQVLLVSPRETAARDQYIERAEKQGERQSVTLQRLTDRLEALTREQNKLSEEKVREIERLNASLLTTEEGATQAIATVRENFVKEHKEARRKHQKTVQMLAEDSLAVKQLYEEESASFRKRELTIRRQKWRLEDQLDSTIRRMDDQLFELQAKYDEAKSQFDQEMKAFEFLKAKFDPLKAEYDEIIEARAKEEEARMQAIRERDEMVKSATFITSLYRAYKARRRIKAERRGRKFSI